MSNLATAAERLAYVSSACAELGAWFHKPGSALADASVDGQLAVWDGKHSTVREVLEYVYPSPKEMGIAADPDDVSAAEELTGRELIRDCEGKVGPDAIRITIAVHMIHQGVAPSVVFA
jgi:hypothetical protein